MRFLAILPIILYLKASEMDVNKIDHWVFDLDNTLYPARFGLFDQISARITKYVQNHFDCPHDQAIDIQKSYFQDYDTTLNGMMRLQNIDPKHFLDFVHDVDFSGLENAPKLTETLKKLPGKKYIFTNADTPYARRVIEKLDLDHMFELICDIVLCDYSPKPKMHAYQTLLNKSDIDPLRAVFFEDMARNLEPAKALGMKTVWINSGSDWGMRGKGDYIDEEIDDIEEYLNALAD